MEAESVLCPEIEHEQIVITPATLNALFLSNENRTVGSTVGIKCLSEGSHNLIGSSLLTCTSSGQWNLPIPTCTPKISPNTSDIIFQPFDPSSNEAQDYSMLPFVVALTLLGITCLVLVILLGYMLRLLSRGGDHQKIMMESRSTTPDLRHQSTESWVELASSLSTTGREDPGHSRENRGMVESLRYSYRPEWSGY